MRDTINVERIEAEHKICSSFDYETESDGESMLHILVSYHLL